MKHVTPLAVCILLGSPLAWNQTAKPAFEVASVKLHEFPPGMTGLQIGGPSELRISGNRVATFGTLTQFVMAAYELRLHQVSGGPEWTDREGNPLTFDIQAKAEGGDALAPDLARQMMQALLADRFRLKLHRETKEMPVYVLTADKNGPRLKETAPGTESKSTSAFSRGVSKFSYTNFSMTDLVTHIASNFDRPLLDKTGFKGSYDFTLEYRRVNPQLFADEAAAMARRGNADAGPSIFDALKLLGLKVIQSKEPFEITIIDQAEKPSEN
jgi:uncharacterized protein (TIGR03435 family)